MLARARTRIYTRTHANVQPCLHEAHVYASVLALPRVHADAHVPTRKRVRTSTQSYVHMHAHAHAYAHAPAHVQMHMRMHLRKRTLTRRCAHGLPQTN